MTGITVLVMGVSGSGKSTVALLLAAALGVEFVDADSLHSESNRAKMAAGAALSDDDRKPWLEAVAEVLAGGSVVVACSALRRRYRDRLRQAAPALNLIYLSGTRALLARRLEGRHHLFMPPTLLDSQLTALEPPDPDEAAIVADISQAPVEIVQMSVGILQQRGAV